MASEFDIIERYFSRPALGDDVVLGVGDDAAVLNLPAGRQLVVAVDTLVAGRHFPETAAAFDIGWKALAVNLSDLAAMGATPTWATLALTLPTVEDDWLRDFAEGFYQLAETHRVSLVGGDTTRGPLSVTVQVQGHLPAGAALRRDAAAPEQALLVSGSLGDAACALRQLQHGAAADPELLQRLNRPQPRVALGQALRGIAAAAIDISDGLLADLGHVLGASGCGATLWPDRLPTSAALQQLPYEQRLACQYHGGDDYELCFTVPAERYAELQALRQRESLALTEIGVIESEPGVRCRYGDGRSESPPPWGFDHFREEDPRD